MRAGTAAWLAVVLCLAISQTAYAKRATGHFRDGVQAADREDWPAVEAAMRRAIQLNGQENSRRIAISGMRYEWYLPHYYLGLALLRQGDSRGAHQAWATSARQGVVFRWRDGEQFRRSWNQLVARFGASPDPMPRRSDPTREPTDLVPATAKERIRAAIESMSRNLTRQGPPITPNAEVLVETCERLLEATDILKQRRIRAERTDEVVAKLQAARESLETLGERPRRRSQRLQEDLLGIVGWFRNSGIELSPSEEKRFLKLEYQLTLNEPEEDLLVAGESWLLCLRHPVLAECSLC